MQPSIKNCMEISYFNNWMLKFDTIAILKYGMQCRHWYPQNKFWKTLPVFWYEKGSFSKYTLTVLKASYISREYWDSRLSQIIIWFIGWIKTMITDEKLRQNLKG